MPNTIPEGVAAAITAISVITEQVAAACGIAVSTADKAIWDGLVNARPRPVNARDGRAARWYARIKLFNHKGEMEARSDETLMTGLPAISSWLAETVTAFHEGRRESLSGLDPETLRQRVKSFRPTLSRNGGAALWRVPYMVKGENWLALVDVARDDVHGKSQTEGTEV